MQMPSSQFAISTETGLAEVTGVWGGLSLEPAEGIRAERGEQNKPTAPGFCGLGIPEHSWSG